MAIGELEDFAHRSFHGRQPEMAASGVVAAVRGSTAPKF